MNLARIVLFAFLVAVIIMGATGAMHLLVAIIFAVGLVWSLAILDDEARRYREDSL